MPDAFISMTTSWASGSGIGELHQFQSALAGEHNPAHRFLRLVFVCGPILNGKT